MKSEFAAKCTLALFLIFAGILIFVVNFGLIRNRQNIAKERAELKQEIKRLNIIIETSKLSREEIDKILFIADIFIKNPNPSLKEIEAAK